MNDGRRLEAAAARMMDIEDTRWLPEQGFEDIVIPISDYPLLRMVEDLGTPEMDDGELRDRLNDMTTDALSIPDRATLIAELTDSGIMPNPPRDLLLDSDVRRIPADKTVYLPACFMKGRSGTSP